MHMENPSNKTNFKILSCKNHVIDRHDNDCDTGYVKPVEIPSEKLHNYGLLQRIYKRFLTGGDGVNFVETNGTDSGVAFFLHFSVHATKKDKQKGEDTRILPVHYSDNCLSLVPGETTTINMSFEMPSGVTPRVTLHGCNYYRSHTVYRGC
ncbi:hypothetical protein GIB67_028279 [Kingdonia uniflora]|uniref:Exo-beta-D-glucosaminidase Ig-fold domain-containing protein n=1 Tax=Kingdonia uniflora TaxID=39325 RepID=A0A7J7KZE7_9MAGN|nr:hypothetical protein GIB67_028279 [Kingdonia uniflora]